MGLTRLLLVLVLCLAVMGATGSIQTMTSRPTDVDCSLAGTDGITWYNTTTALLRTCSGGSALTITTGGAGGSAIILDLGNDSSLESIALGKVSTTGDLFGIFTELSTDVLLIDASRPWPSASELSGSVNACPVGQFTRGINQAGDAQSCTALPTTITGTPGQIGVSTPIGAVNIFIPNNPTMPGMVTAGGFIGPLTGNVTGNVSGSAATATALAANGPNCAAGNAPLGVDTLGGVEGCFDVATQAELNTVSAAAARQGGTSPCAIGEIFKTTAGPIWSCATDASGGAGGVPGGANTQVQFNDSGVFGGDAGLTYNKTTDILTVLGGFVGPLAWTNLTSVPTTLVKTDQGNTYSTGDQSFAAASSLTLPSTPGANPTTSGRMAYDSTANAFEGGVSGVNKTFAMTDGNIATATALAANGANCSLPQFPLGVSANGAAENCTPLPTSITGTTNQITASASTGAVNLSISTNPIFPGLVTAGGFSGPLTGNATTATALAAEPSDCPAGQAPVGVDAAGNASGCFAVAPLPSMQTPSALAAASQIACTSTTVYVAGSGGPVTLTAADWIVAGTSTGQECTIIGSDNTNTVTAPNTTGVRLAGNKGSVVFGGLLSGKSFTWTGAHWRQTSLAGLQQQANESRIIGDAILEADGVVTGDSAGGNYCVEFGNQRKCYCGGVVCPMQIITNPTYVMDGAKPTCDASRRGQRWDSQGGTTVADTSEVCRKKADDTYAWITEGTRGTVTTTLPLGVDTIDFTNSNATLQQQNRTNYSTNRVVEFVDSGNGCIFFTTSVPANVSATPNWNLVIDHSAFSGTGGNIVLTLDARTFANNVAKDAALTSLASGMPTSYAVNTSANNTRSTLGSTNFDSLVPLSANDLLRMKLCRTPGAALDNLGVVWMLEHTRLRIDVN